MALDALNAQLWQRSREEDRPFEPMLFIIGMSSIQLASWDFDFPASGGQ